MPGPDRVLCQLLGATFENTQVEENFNQAVRHMNYLTREIQQDISKHKEAWDAFERAMKYLNWPTKRCTKLKDYKLKDGPTPKVILDN